MGFFKTYFAKLERFKNERTAFYFFEAALSSCNRWGYLCGLSILSPDYKVVNFRLIYLTLFNIIFTFVNIYSVIQRTSLGMVEVFISSVTIGMTLQGLIKQYTFAKHRKEIIGITESGIALYNELQGEKIKKIARDIAFYGWMFIMHFLRYAYIGAVFLAVWAPSILSFFTGKPRELPLEIELPFIDKNTEQGYWINFLYICNAAAYELVGLQASDGFYLALLLNAFTQLENIFFELENLNRLVENETTNDPKEVREKLKQVLKLHQKYIKFIQHLNEMFLPYFSVNIVTMVYQIVVALFVIVTVNTKICAPILVFTGTSQLFIICAVGTALESKHEKLVRATYDICWYNMEITERMKVKLMLQATQQDIYIEYLFGRLNLPLFMEIYKKIYSGLMMLVNRAE
ncbi:odorant receptor 22c-like [Culicoides brevitarsis]|uniref:odorant receptor 22c-like n=1 Tax=Culicoides brevitarsis TaxID=469753 RepID=UPI00307BBCFB